MIIYSKHAKTRMAERHISQKRIVATLRNPGVIFKGYGGALVANKKFGKETLGVVLLRRAKILKR